MIRRRLVWIAALASVATVVASAAPGGAAGPLGTATASATIYANPGPMPPKGSACAADPSAPCAVVSPQCSHIVAPAMASNGDFIELKTDPATPCNAWTYDELPGEQLSACYLPDTSGGGGGYVYPYGNEPLNVCRVRVDTSGLTIYHQNPSGGWETTTGPGWTKVGVNDICGSGCSQGYENEDETWMAVIPPPPGPTPPPVPPTTPVPAGLGITLTPSPSPVVVPQTTKGAVPQQISVKVTVTNRATSTVHGVSFANPLDIVPVGHTPVNIDVSGCPWAAAAGLLAATSSATAPAAKPPPPCPIEEASGPPNPAAGDLAPGQSASATYTLTVRGDGDYTLYATVSGTRADSNGNQVPVNAIGQLHYQPDSQLLVMSVSPGTSKASPLSSKLKLSGAPFTEILHLENRSFYRRLLVLPKIVVGGNVVGGIVQETTDPVPDNPPAVGTPDEVVPNPIIELDPRQSHDYAVVFWSSRSDAIKSSKTPSGGTRGTVQFLAPDIATEDDNNHATDGDPSQVVAPKGTFDEQLQSFDDSQPAQAPFNLLTGGFAFARGAVTAIWHLTTSFLHGTFIDLPKGAVTLIPSLIYKDIELEAQLYKEIQGNPALQLLYYNALTHQVLLAFRFASDLVPTTAQAYSAVSSAVGTELSRIYSEWKVGDWKGAINDLSAETGDGAGQITSLVGGPLALTKTLALAGEMGVLSRVRPALQALATTTRVETASAEAKIVATGAEADIATADRAAQGGHETAQTLGERATADEEAAKLLDEGKIPEGVTLDPNNPKDLELFAAASGISPVEAGRLAELAKARGEILVCRSRGSGSIERLKDGAYLKPFEIKAKNMNPLDRFLFGWPSKLQDLVVIDRDLPHAKLPFKQAVIDFGNDLQARGLTPGSAPYEQSLTRYKTQWKQTNQLLPKYEKWAKTLDVISSKATGKVKGVYKGVAELTWDATENPRNFSSVPEFNPRDATKVRFRLTGYDAAGNVTADQSKIRYLLPEVKPLGGKWGAITGDIDWLSFADAEGAQLDDARNIGLLNDLGHLGAQHPESASWFFNGKFLFDAKLEFLSGYNEAELEAAGGIGKQVNFEFGPDGKIRTVVLDYHASEFTSPTQTRVVWRGGYRYANP